MNKVVLCFYLIIDSIYDYSISIMSYVCKCSCKLNSLQYNSNIFMLIYYFLNIKKISSEDIVLFNSFQ